jgi:NTP pyrophosphatase (non-canonical NTP hydrolase)
MPMQRDIDEITDALLRFRDERDWEQFHNSKDLALAISIEAAELNEIFLWKQAEDVDLAALREELADVLSFCFLLASKHKLDIKEIILDKINTNTLKYHVNKAKGRSEKYIHL